MSIPGLGQIPAQPVASSTRTINLKPGCEWRFQVPIDATLICKLVSGLAEKDGVELAPRNAYKFSGIKSKILSWHGCQLELDGRCEEESTAEYANPAANPGNSYLNLHARLTDMRTTAAREGREGPRVLIVGPQNTGKTTLARTLTSYATRQGWQPIVVNADPNEGMLSLPGTLTASVFATIIDAEAVDGWGSTPTSGPSTVPVKLPLAFYYGRQNPEDDADFYRELMSRMAGTVSGRLSEDPSVRSSGVIVDAMGVGVESTTGLDLISHIVDEISINVVVVLGSTELSAEMDRRLGSEKTSLGEPIHVVALDQSDGVVKRSEAYMQSIREAAIKEYFFGNARRTLSPQIQQVDFDTLVVLQPSEYAAQGQDSLVREEVSGIMEHWTLAVMNASVRDSPETIRAANVMGFVYVSDVDEERRKIKVLAPVGGRLGDRPLVLGEWPEPYINLLG